MFCKWCGVPNDDDAVFCTGCGRSVDDRTNPVATPVPQITQNVAPPTSSEPFASAVVASSPPPGRRNPVIPILVVIVVALGLTLGGILLLRSRDDTVQRAGDAGQRGARTSEPAADPVTSDVDPANTSQVASSVDEVEPVTGTAATDPQVTDPPVLDPAAGTVAAPPPDVPPGDGVLRLGGLVPETGNLAFLGPPMQAGIDLAVGDVNAAGGVRGAPIEFLAGDSGDNGDMANATADRLIGGGVDGFIGAASSGVSLTVIDKITQGGRVLFSPANTSTVFTEYDDSGLYFRTAPSDEMQGAALADLILADGHSSVVLLMLDDSYATQLGDFFTRRFTANGGSLSDSLIYGSGSLSDAQIAPLRDSVLNNAPDAVVIVGFDETSVILDAMIGAGDGPRVRAFYGTDGNMGNALGSSVQQPAALNGMRGTLPGVDVIGVAPEFADRLDAVDGGLVDYSYSAESYDAVVVMALAVEAARSDDAVGFAPQIVEVTRGGQVCTSFAECRDLILDGIDIDYDGVSGPLDMSDVGDITAGSILTVEFDSSGQTFIAGHQITRI